VRTDLNHANLDQADLTRAKILLVDDQPTNLKLLRQALEPSGYSILAATNGKRALDTARRAHPDLILMDVMMPEMGGFEACQKLKADAELAQIPVLFITARNETEDVVEGFAAGGADYIAKPFRNEEVLARVRTHLERAFFAKALNQKNIELEEKNAALEKERTQRQILSGQKDQLKDQLSMLSAREAERWGISDFIGRSPLLPKVLHDIQLLQHSSSTSVLITGESGTGKELVARALHFGSGRSAGPFVVVNCSAIPADLAESQFFGHVKGAFTGASTAQKGHFELADGGTLFLDEVGDMSAGMQAKLLRVLEDGIVTPVGAEKGRPVDVRVVSATNADLEAAIAADSFRQDLFFRLASFPVQVPPLRGRPEDIPLLVEHFLALFAAEMGQVPPPLNAVALALLEAYAFPGNIRELKNIVERALIESGGGEVLPVHLHFIQSTAKTDQAPSKPSDPSADLPLNLAETETILIRRALAQTEGNIAAAARLLGTNRPHLYRFLKKEEKGNRGS
jgi:DNA-binding NtrC family response regulator